MQFFILEYVFFVNCMMQSLQLKVIFSTIFNIFSILATKYTSLPIFSNWLSTQYNPLNNRDNE